MSGAQTSTFADPNILYKTLSGAGYQEVEQNRLLNQGRERGLAADDIEMIGRGAGSLLQLPDEASRAAQYPAVVAQLQQYGVKAALPATYPGEAALRRALAMGTPSAELFRLGVDRQAKGAIAPGDDGTTATGGTGRAAPTTGGVAANAGVLRDQLVSTLGVSPVDAGAILSNFHAESGLNAGINEIHPAIPGSRGGYGLAQWTGSRRVALEAFAQQNKLDVSQPATQLAFMKQELQQPEYAGVLKAMQAAQTPEEKASIFFHGYLSGNAPSLEHNLPGHVARARAYAGLPAAQADAAPPGAPTAPAAPPGVQMGGDVPPPPGGAPGAYPAYGGGFGSVIGQPPAAARATSPFPAGRPTGPPVVTDQPAGGGVVAGPPGTAVVGQPVPASPAVAGNVAAINAGIVRAGGQPGADPYATPAQYAGIAPAPSVEAAPQPGWGTGIGSGYGPQNALAPAPVPPAPARPAAPAVAQPAAAQPPAADTLPPLPAPTPPAPTNRNGLTAFQQQDIERRRGMTNVSSDELQKRVDAYSAANAAAAEKYQQDSIAYVREARERQAATGAARHQTVEEQRQASADAAAAAEREYQHQKDAATAKLAADKAAREAAEAAQLQKSKSDEADAERVLMAIGPKVRSGVDLTEAEADQYDIARRRYARGPLQQVPDGKGGTITAFVGQEVPDRFPPLPGQKEYAGLKPVPGTEKQPDFAPANATTAMLDIGEGQRKIMRTLASLQKYPGGVGPFKGSQPNIMANWTDPEGVNLRADVGDVKSHIYHTLSGSAVTAIEEPRLTRFSPQETDSAEALKTKLQRMMDLNRETQLDHYRAFGPEAGGRRNPAVEDSILATIPQAALDHLKENPTTTKDFDKMYGRGAAKLALQHG